MSQDVVGGRLHIDVESETTGLGRELQQKINVETRNVRARIRAELDTRGLREEARRAANDAGARERVRIRAELDDTGLAQKARAAAKVASDSARVKIGAELDDASWAKAGSEIAGLTADRAVHVQVHADTARARAEIEKLREEARRGVDMPVRTGPSGAGAGGAAASTLSGIADSLMGGGKIAALIGGIYALGVAAVQAGAGLFAMASAASQAVITLAVLPNVLATVLQAGLGLFAAFSGIGGGIAALTKEQQGLGAQTQQVAQQQQSSARAIAAAQHQIGQARQQAADDAHQAAESIADGEWAVSRAQKGAKQAQDDLNAAREQARQDIRDLRVELQRSSLDEKAAANALAKAKQHLQDVRWDKSATSQDRKDAQLAVAEAQQQYDDAKKHRSDTKKQYDDASKDGVKNADVVKAAQDQVLVSNHDLMIAERNLADTRHGNAETAVNDAYAIAQAQQALADAQKSSAQQAVAQVAATTDLLADFNKLSPAGQAFARFIVNTVLPRLREIRADAQEALLPPLQEGIRRALPLLDTIDSALVKTDRILGRMFISVGTLFGSKGFNRDTSQIMGTNARAIAILSRAVVPLINMFRDLAVVAGPHLLIPFAKWIAKMIEGASEAVHTARETGRLADKFDSARHMAALLWDILKNVIGAIHGMGRAATPAGDDLLRTLDKVTRKWDKWANSPKAQKQMREYFKAVEPLTKELGTLVVNLGKFLAVAGKAGGGPVGGFVKTLNFILSALTGIMGLPVIGGGVSAILTMAGGAGAVAFLAGGVLKLWGNLAKLAKLTGITKVFSAFRGSVLETRLQLMALSAWEGIVAAATWAWQTATVALGIANKGAFIQITVVVGIIAALVAGFILAYKHIGWFHAAVDAVVHAVVGAFKWLWDVLFGHSIIPDIVDGLKWFFDQAKKVFGWVGDAIHVLGQVFGWLWDHIIKPYFTLYGKAISLYWNYYVKPMFKLIGLAVRVLGAVFSWLWNHAIKPAWHGIQGAIDLAWNYYYKPILKLMRLELRVLGAVFSWLWDHAVRPAWNAIQNAIRWAWRNIIKPDLALLRAGLHAVGDVFSWLWDHAVRPAWNLLTGAVRDGWNNVIKPVFSALSDFVHDHVRPAFSRAIGALKDIWNGLASAAQKPVNFLVNTLYNEGIRKVINLIPGVPDLDPLSVNLKFADGGVMPGFSPGRDIHRFVSGSGMTLDLSGGESVMRPEWTKLIGTRAVNAMNAAARKGGTALARLLGSFAGYGDVGVSRAGQAAFASGGTIPDNLMSSALSFAQAQVGKPYLWGSAGPSGFDCSGFMSAITNVLLGYSNPFSRRGSTATFPWLGFAPGTGQFTIGSVKDYGGSGVGHMAGTLIVGSKGYNVESRGGEGPIVGSRARGFFDAGFNTIGHLGLGMGPAPQSADGGGGGGVFHLIGQVKDLIGKVPGMLRDLGKSEWGQMLVKGMKSVGGGFRDWVNGKIWGPGPIPGDIFDAGGWLNPGLTLAYNGTSNPERVYTHEQMLGLSHHVTRLTDNRDQRQSAAPLVGSLALSVGKPEEVGEVFDDLDHELRILRLGGVSEHSTAD